MGLNDKIADVFGRLFLEELSFGALSRYRNSNCRLAHGVGAVADQFGRYYRHRQRRIGRPHRSRKNNSRR